MPIHQLSTLITDLLLSGFCLFLWWKLPDDRSRFAPAWLHRQSFAVLAAAAFAGGIGHGFDRMLEPSVVRIVWNFSQVAGCAWAYLLALSAVAELQDSRVRRFLTVFLTIKLVLMAALAVSDTRFIWVVSESAGSLVVAGALSAWRWHKTGAARYRYLLLGVAVSFAGAGVQVARVSPHAQFTHNDLFHMILMGAVWCFYRGAVSVQPAE